MSEAGASVSSGTSRAVADAENYYDSDDADRFYSAIWGGEDIHIGIYDQPDVPIREASHKTLQLMVEQLGELGNEARVLDIGAGYGGAGRYLASRFGCRVTCLNLSEVQNEKNRRLTEEAGLSDKVNVVYGNFEDLPFEESSFDLVWAQDAILHSGNRPRVLSEVARMLKTEGSFIFTDPMQADDCPQGVLGPVLDRIHLESLGSPAFYEKSLTDLGLQLVSYLPLTEHLGRHYGRVAQELEAHREKLRGQISDAYVEKMLQGLQHWVNAEQSGYLAWGILHFRAP